MRRILIGFILLCSSFTLFAQDWSPIVSNSGQSIIIPEHVYVGNNIGKNLVVRHVNGKDYQSNSNGDLFLNWDTAKHVYVGRFGGLSSNFYVTGNVGIGTSSPQHKLDVRGNISAARFKTPLNGTISSELNGSNLNFTRDNLSYINSTNANGGIAIRTGGRNELDLVIRKEGNIGIGTSDTKGNKLRVNGSRVIVGDNNWAGFTLDGKNANDWTINAHSDERSLYFRTQGDGENKESKLAMVIKRDSGNVGIGTPSPTAGLEVKSDLGIKVQSKTSGGWLGSIKMTDGILEGTEARDDLKFSASGGFIFKMDDNSNGISSIPGFNIYDRNNNSVFSVKEADGKVGIGTTTTGIHKLAVEGSIGAREIKVQATGWSDFVFENNYNLPTLKEVENHISENGHLKDIPSAKEVEKDGFFLGQMDAKLLQKIEELTLYTIQQEKKIEKLEEKLDSFKGMETQLNELKSLILNLKK